MVSETTLQKTVSKQRQMLTTLLFRSMSNITKACAGKMNNRQSLDELLTSEMHKAGYCKYLWVVDKTGRQITEDVTRSGFRQGQIGRDRIARPYLQRALRGDDYYLVDP